MLSSPLIDLAIGGGSFGISSLIGFISKGFNVSAQKHRDMINALSALTQAPTEEDKKRTHELALQELTFKDEGEKRTYNDIQNARHMQSRFVGITRRGLAWSTLFLLLLLGIAAFISLYQHVPAVSIPTTSTHSLFFGLFNWTSHGVQELTGLAWLPWFQTWFFMIGGFYFGREATK